ncbi:helix-turn-helix transcriptional regulator [Desulfosporosinus fructosivorans]
MATLVTNIKKYRFSAEMSQAKLADLVGVRRETIVHLETGKYNPSLKLAFDIAKIFNVPIEEIFTYRD